MALTTAEVHDRIRGIGGQPVPPLASPLAADPVIVLDGPGPDADDYLNEQADFDGWEETEPEE